MADLTGLGTPEIAWTSDETLMRLPFFAPVVPTGRVLLVGPHPDDEVLGAGGSCVVLAAAGARVELVAVTDGEASHPGRARELAGSRPGETTSALAELGLAGIRQHRLGLADGGVQEATVRAALLDLVAPGDLVLAPWDHDGHPDHDAVGRAALAATATRGAGLLQWLVWAWHWARPGTDDLPWWRAARSGYAPSVQDAKLHAAACFTSQLAGPAPILPVPVLARLLRPYEVLLR